MKVVFIDSFYLIALFNSRDSFHHRAKEFMAARGSKKVTTDFILMEFADALASSNIREQVVEFVDDLRSMELCEVIPATRELLDEGLKLYRKRPDKEWSLTDCISFTVMENKGISDALTGDKHFDQAGFRALFR